MISLFQNIYTRLYDHRKFYFILIILIIGFIVAQKKINVNPLVDKESIQYVNSIYMSDGKMYNEYLTDKQKDMYLLILSKIKNHKRVTKEPLANFGCISYGECVTNIRTAADAIMIDHPELLSYGGWNLQFDDASGILTFRIENSFKLPLMNAIGEMIINKKIDAIEEQTKNMTDREKIKYVYDWIGANTVYDTVFTHDSKNQTIYNVFINKNAVCAGFAKAAQVIFQAIGIESYTVTGYTSGPHMWNIVKVDNEYYYFDSTWAACIKEEHPEYYNGLKTGTFATYEAQNPEYKFKMSTKELFDINDLK